MKKVTAQMAQKKGVFKYALAIKKTAHEAFDIEYKITASTAIIPFLRTIYDSDTLNLNESFYVVFLNKSNVVIGYQLHSVGGIAGTVVDNNLIVASALLCNASALIVSHNHPSGNLQPSNNDLKFTVALKSACNFFNIMLLDHVIITENSYYSFADNSQI